MYVVIQEGGTSDELYVSGWDTEAEAEEHRVDCADGAYRTTPVFEAPEGFDLEVLAEALEQLSELGYPEEEE